MKAVLFSLLLLSIVAFGFAAPKASISEPDSPAKAKPDMPKDSVHVDNVLSKTSTNSSNTNSTFRCFCKRPSIGEPYECQCNSSTVKQISLSGASVDDAVKSGSEFNILTEAVQQAKDGDDKSDDGNNHANMTMTELSTSPSTNGSSSPEIPPVSETLTTITPSMESHATNATVGNTEAPSAFNETRMEPHDMNTTVAITETTLASNETVMEPHDMNTTMAITETTLASNETVMEPHSPNVAVANTDPAAANGTVTEARNANATIENTEAPVASNGTSMEPHDANTTMGIIEVPASPAPELNATSISSTVGLPAIVEAVVICTKHTATGTAWDWLTDINGKAVRVPGFWRSHQCSYGVIESFAIGIFDFMDVTVRCRANGFELAQPNDAQHTGWNPFQVEQALSEYFRELAPSVFDLAGSTSVGAC